MARRSAVFFYTDAHAAADTAAQEMADHGLRADRVTALGEAIGRTITDFFDRERDREGGETDG